MVIITGFGCLCVAVFDFLGLFCWIALEFCVWWCLCWWVVCFLGCVLGCVLPRLAGVWLVVVLLIVGFVCYRFWFCVMLHG